MIDFGHCWHYHLDAICTYLSYDDNYYLSCIHCLKFGCSFGFDCLDSTTGDVCPFHPTYPGSARQPTCEYGYALLNQEICNVDVEKVISHPLKFQSLVSILCPT